MLFFICDLFKAFPLIISDNELQQAASNDRGQLGIGPYGKNRSTPVETTRLKGVNLKKITGGGYHSAAITTDGTVYTWGSNYWGDLEMSRIWINTFLRL